MTSAKQKSRALFPLCRMMRIWIFKTADLGICGHGEKDRPGETFPALRQGCHYAKRRKTDALSFADIPRRKTITEMLLGTVEKNSSVV